jgi:hypothetical protein
VTSRDDRGIQAVDGGQPLRYAIPTGTSIAVKAIPATSTAAIEEQ